MAVYEVVQFFQHPKLDRKVMRVKVTPTKPEEEPETTREFYWEPTAYRNRSDEALVAEVRKLLGLKAEDVLECPR